MVTIKHCFFYNLQMSVRLRVRRQRGSRVHFSISNSGPRLSNVFIASNTFKPLEIGSISEGETRDLPGLRIRFSQRDGHWHRHEHFGTDGINIRGGHQHHHHNRDSSNVYLVQFLSSGPELVSNVLTVFGDGQGPINRDNAIHVRINARFSDYDSGMADMDIYLRNNSGKNVRDFMMGFPNTRLSATSSNQKLRVTSNNRWNVPSVALRQNHTMYAGERLEHMHVNIQTLASNMNILRSTKTMDLPRNPGDLLGGLNIFARATADDGSRVPVVLTLNTRRGGRVETTF